MIRRPPDVGCTTAEFNKWLSDVDNTVRQVLVEDNLPLYYGGTVRVGLGGDNVYVNAKDKDGESNYPGGQLYCANILLGLRKLDPQWSWWNTYNEIGRPKPNCWRKHADNPYGVQGSVPVNVKEVALYDLLKGYLRDLEKDAAKAANDAGYELWRFQ